MNRSHPELIYNLSEQGKEFLDVSAPAGLVQSFQLTRELTNRQVSYVFCLKCSIHPLFITPSTVNPLGRSTNCMILWSWMWSAVLRRARCL